MSHRWLFACHGSWLEPLDLAMPPIAPLCRSATSPLSPGANLLRFNSPSVACGNRGSGAERRGGQRPRVASLLIPYSAIAMCGEYGCRASRPSERRFNQGTRLRTPSPFGYSPYHSRGRIANLRATARGSSPARMQGGYLRVEALDPLSVLVVTMRGHSTPHDLRLRMPAP